MNLKKENKMLKHENNMLKLQILKLNYYLIIGYATYILIYKFLTKYVKYSQIGSQSVEAPGFGSDPMTCSSRRRLCDRRSNPLARVK